jgi:hypothetical protein
MHSATLAHSSAPVHGPDWQVVVVGLVAQQFGDAIGQSAPRVQVIPPSPRKLYQPTAGNTGLAAGAASLAGPASGTGVPPSLPSAASRAPASDSKSTLPPHDGPTTTR